VKILATRKKTPLEFVSGPKMTPKGMVGGVQRLAADWSYDLVSIGYPGPVSVLCDPSRSYFTDTYAKSRCAGAISGL